jgi:microcystin-dependent protein
VSAAYLGEIRMFAGDFEPVGWAFCQGQTLRIEDHVDVYEIVGTTYGGDGVQTFNLPDLRGRVPIHRGPDHAVGQSGGDLQNAPPPASVSFIIALSGFFPREDRTLQELDPFTAEIRIFAFGRARRLGGL